MSATLTARPGEVLAAIARLEVLNYFALIAYALLRHVSFFLPLIFYQYLTLRCALAPECKGLSRIIIILYIHVCLSNQTYSCSFI
jgi:hypothetical protein